MIARLRRRPGRPAHSLRLPGLPGLLLPALLVLASCSGPIVANPALSPAPVPTASPSPTRLPDPQPVILPRDDGPHDRLTEWWYYTGHLRDQSGGRWGFEFVVFRAERGSIAVSWASHLALTDEAGGTFSYAQRAEVGPQVDGSPRDAAGVPTGFDLGVAGLGASPAAPPDVRWTLSGSNGRDHLSAHARSDEVAPSGIPFGIDLDLTDPRGPLLHDGDGWVDFGPAGGSYYYSRPRMAAEGTLSIGDRHFQVEGTAWFDHQWGDFVSVGGGGWDWFAVNLEDGTDLTVSLVRAADGSYPLVYGTIRATDDAAAGVRLGPGDFEVRRDPSRTWTSPATGVTYPAGWTVTIPSRQLVIDLMPTVPAQELDTRATTGVIYWEGSQVVRATRAGEALSGAAYVELTGYGDAP